jgi:16S rRNA (cytidine1402-2'-O)-methyltransferase
VTGARTDPPRQRGSLLVCATPLGNLQDITLRCLEALRSADTIVAEDTRVTRTLLARYDIRTPLRSYHAGNAASRERDVAALLRAGKTVALVSDAGMPGISDPGSELVREARAAGASVEVLPGPSAVVSALVLSGFDAGKFRFDGFPPRKSGERRTYLATLKSETRSVVWFEAPTRVRDLLSDVAMVLADRRVFVLREYTKKFEEQLLGTALDVRSRLTDPPRGEFTLVLEGARSAVASSAGDVEAAIRYLRSAGLSAKDAAEAIRVATGAPRNELYRLALQAKRTR